MKQTYDLENIRLLKYRSLQDIVMLVLCAMYFASVHLRILAYHALKKAKRLFSIPDFRYYAILQTNLFAPWENWETSV